MTQRSGVRVTTPLRTALDLARIAPLEEAVVCLDRLVEAKIVRLPDVVHAVARFGGPGCRHMQNVDRDRMRLSASTAAGWTVVFVTAADLSDPVALVARIGATGPA